MTPQTLQEKMEQAIIIHMDLGDGVTVHDGFTGRGSRKTAQMCAEIAQQAINEALEEKEKKIEEFWFTLRGDYKSAEVNYETSEDVKYLHEREEIEYLLERMQELGLINNQQ